MKTHKVFTGAAAFAVGAMIGYAAAWKASKKFYEQKTKEAIESVKKAYRPLKSQKDINYHEVIEQYDTQSTAADANKSDGKEEPAMARKEPYEISPQEFGTRKGYSCVQLISCADGIITHDDGEIVEDEEELLGDYIFDRIDAADGGSVYIRDDNEKCDYEIVSDERDYEDIQFAEPFDPEDL